MKTAAEWLLENNRGDMHQMGAYFSITDIENVQSDARAGMVPEASWFAMRDARDDARAELAKAWEAAIGAAASTVLDSGTGLLPGPALERIAASVRKLQPPRGEPKTCGADLIWMRPGNRPGGLIPCNRPAGHEGAHQALTSELTGGKPK